MNPSLPFLFIGPFTKLIILPGVDVALSSRVNMFDVDVFSNRGLLKINIDVRTHIFKDIHCSQSVKLNLFFPLSREKYNITCLVKTVSRSEGKNKIKPFTEENLLLFSHLEKLDCTNHNKDILNYINKLDKEIAEESSNLLTKSWSELNEEDKLLYEILSPDSYKSNEKLIHDIDKFDSQEKITPIDNFGIVILLPYIIERTIYPKPQVIANTRKQNFESLYKPRKVQTKYIYWLNTFNTDSLSFNIRELNT